MIPVTADTPLGVLLPTLFLAGLTGGFAHCIAMCGPFVMAQVSSRLEGVPAAAMDEGHRLTGGLLVPYHLGRATTYAALGAVAAQLSGALSLRWDLRWISFALLAAAAVFFTVQGLRGLGVPLPRLVSRDPSGEGPVARALGSLAKPFFQNPTGWRGYALGLVLGLLPCGLVYGALAAAAATGTIWGGALAMTAFSLGTMPALAGVGIAGQAAGRAMRTLMRRVGPLFLFLGAGLLVVMAWRTVGAL